MSLLALSGVVIVAGSAGLAAIGDVRQGWVAGRVGAFVGLFGAQFAAFVAALFGVRAIARRRGDSTGALVLAASVAVAARLVLILFSWPNLSDDIHRYVWEGMAQQRGLNPYLTKPDEAPEAVRATPEGRAVTHGHIAAIYPPLTELTFRLVYSFARTARGYRAALLSFDLATVAVLAALLRRAGQSPLWAVMYAWHPLVITEFAASGHFDSLGILWMTLAVYALQRPPRTADGPAAPTRRRWGLAAYAALGASVAVKYIAAPLVLFFWPRTRRWHALAAAAVVLLLWWPYLPGGYAGVMEDAAALVRGDPPPHETWRVLAGLRSFVAGYHSNAGLHDSVLALTGEDSTHDPVARAVMALLLLALLVGLAVRRVDLPTAGLFALGGMAVMTRVVHPWYVCWIVPWLALKAAQEGTFLRWSTAAWLLFSGLVATSYAVLIGYVPTMHDPEPRWVVPAWSLWLQYAPLVALLAIGGLRARRSPPCSRRGGSAVQPRRLQGASEVRKGGG